MIPILLKAQESYSIGEALGELARSFDHECRYVAWRFGTQQAFSKYPFCFAAGTTLEWLAKVSSRGQPIDLRLDEFMCLCVEV